MARQIVVLALVLVALVGFASAADASTGSPATAPTAGVDSPAPTPSTSSPSPYSSISAPTPSTSLAPDAETPGEAPSPFFATARRNGPAPTPEADSDYDDH